MESQSSKNSNDKGMKWKAMKQYTTMANDGAGITWLPIKSVQTAMDIRETRKKTLIRVNTKEHAQEKEK